MITLRLELTITERQIAGVSSIQSDIAGLVQDYRRRGYLGVQNSSYFWFGFRVQPSPKSSQFCLRIPSLALSQASFPSRQASWRYSSCCFCK